MLEGAERIDVDLAVLQLRIVGLLARLSVVEFWPRLCIVVHDYAPRYAPMLIMVDYNYTVSAQDVLDAITHLSR